jgi:hypothetical protein
MTKLRKASIQQILNTLDNTIFTSHAFEAKFNVSDSEIVRIAFKEDKHSSFAIKRDGGTWLTYEAPGPILVDQEITRLGDLASCINRIKPWADRILEEYITTSSPDALQKMRERIDSFADSMPQPEKPFNADEAREFSAKLEDMIRKFEEVQAARRGHRAAARPG